MSKRTRTLAWVWLGLGGMGLPAGGLLGIAAAMSGGDAAALGIVVAVTVFLWAAPLIVGSVALLQGRPYGWWVLMVDAAVWCLLWLLAILTMMHDLMMFPIAAVMLGFSGLTVWWLKSDPPSEWNREASRQPRPSQVALPAGMEEGARFVRTMRAQGSSDDDLVESLRASGWADADVEALLAPPAPAPPRPHKTVVSPHTVRMAAYAGVGLLLVAVAVAFRGPLVEVFSHVQEKPPALAAGKVDWAPLPPGGRAIEAQTPPANEAKRSTKIVEVRIPPDSEGKTFAKEDVTATVRTWKRQGDTLRIGVDAVCPPLPHDKWLPPPESHSLKVEALAADGKRITPSTLGWGWGDSINIDCTYRLVPATGVVPAVLVITFCR